MIKLLLPGRYRPFFPRHKTTERKGEAILKKFALVPVHMELGTNYQKEVHAIQDQSVVGSELVFRQSPWVIVGSWVHLKAIPLEIRRPHIR